MAISPLPPLRPQNSQTPCQLQPCLQAEARNPNVPMRTLVSAHMTAWAAGSAYPVAKIRSSLGQAGWHPYSFLAVPPAMRESATKLLLGVNECHVCCAITWMHPSGFVKSQQCDVSRMLCYCIKQRLHAAQSSMR